MRQGPTYFLTSLAVALIISGCLSTGRPLPGDQVRSLVPETSTKTAMFDMFGAPTAIAGKNGVLETAVPQIWQIWDKKFPVDPTSTEPLFLLFPDATDAHRIYYYRYTQSTGFPVILLFFNWMYSWTTIDRLWVLVDERTGVIADYAYKAYTEDVVFGGQR